MIKTMSKDFNIDIEENLDIDEDEDEEDLNFAINQKKEENYELKSLPIKKLNAIYQHEPRMRKNNRQMNLLNNEN